MEGEGFVVRNASTHVDACCCTTPTFETECVGTVGAGLDIRIYLLYLVTGLAEADLGCVDCCIPVSNKALSAVADCAVYAFVGV